MKIMTKVYNYMIQLYFEKKMSTYHTVTFISYHISMMKYIQGGSSVTFFLNY